MFEKTNMRNVDKIKRNYICKSVITGDLEIPAEYVITSFIKYKFISKASMQNCSFLDGFNKRY